MIYKFNFIEKLLLSKDIIPHPLSDIGSNVGLAKALGVAVKLKITDQLSNKPISTSIIAEKCIISEKGVELVLDCLDALGYVDKSDAGYKFNKRGHKFLSNSSPDNFKYFILFADWTFNSFTTLEDTIKSGVNDKMNLENFGDYEWKIFSRAMIELAGTNISEVIKKIKISTNAKNIIDLGGSHGLYSIELCKNKNDLTATILDLEPVRKYADECIEKNGIGERVKFRACDFRKQEIPSNNDIALLFNIIHGLQSEESGELFKRVFDALNANGQLIVLDQIKGTGGKSQLAKATTSFMALNLFHQANGNTYSYEEVKNWALKAGFKSVKLKKLNAPGFALIICEK
jgi:cyclopropane fatty-acyl-phospholipid synthase-like methyltransferase